MIFGCTKDPKTGTEKTKEDEIYKSSNPYLNPTLTYGVVKDIDGNVYPTIKIGDTTTSTESKRIADYSKVWMAENLRTTKYNDGTTIPNVTDGTVWKELSTSAMSNYDNNTANDTAYGKLYNWYAVNTGKLCPKGWHIPTDGEWTELSNYLESNAAGKLKSTTGWNSDGNGDNSSGFTGLPGGVRDTSRTIRYIGNFGYWWSSTESSYMEDIALNMSLNYLSSSPYLSSDFKGSGMSCRCVQD